MVITATELKANLGRYLDAAKREDIFVTRRGKVVAKISNPTVDKVALLDSLVGVAAGVNMTHEEARAERLTHLSHKPELRNDFFAARTKGEAPVDFLNPEERDQGEQNRDPFEGWRE
jgi:antitoxin (DNA-binding transcriptional repressor) of toxin-antitoxin stability system